MIGGNGCFVTQLPSVPVGSTFIFKGKFADANKKQWFTVNFTDGSHHDFEFKKIKSLFFSDPALTFPPCNLVVPNQAQPLVFPRCQATSATISFPNIQWHTTFESPDICFGTVTDYEYQLPAGWSIGANVSTGSNWIPGGNDVVVTSDLSTGNGVNILIKASNISCGAGLYANGPYATVLISRPSPTFSISGAQAICTGSSTYYLNGLPPGATVSWSLSSTAYASIPNPSSGTSVNVTRIGNLNTDVILYATVTDCSQTYPPVSKVIALGKPRLYTGSTPYKVWYGNSSTDYNNVCNYYTTVVDMTARGATSVVWTRVAATPTNTNWSQNGTYLSFYFWAVGQTAVFKISASNACGLVDQKLGFKSISCGGGGGCRQYTVSPNPAKGFLNIIVPNIPPPCDYKMSATNSKMQSPVITQVNIFDNAGNLKYSQKANKAKAININLQGFKNGIYYVEIKDSKYSERQKIVIEE